MSEGSSATPGPVSPTRQLLAQAQDRFISTWGQMAGAWGISRTMAEVHALLYISAEPLCADDVMERLQISRGNASMSLRALQDWGIITRVHKRGDRKEYFEADSDVWAMVKSIARERKKRELDPVVAALFEIRDMTGVTGKNPDEPYGGDGSGGADRSAKAQSASRNGKRAAASPQTPEDAELLRTHNQRLDAMIEFMSVLERVSASLVSPEGADLREAIAALARSR